MGLFQEYMDSKGKIRKPVVDISGGQVDPKTPPNAPKGGKPYVANGSKKGCKGSEKGFAELGDKDLKQMPAVASGKGKAPAKIPTVEQFELASLVADSIQSDPSVIERIVSEAKKRGMLGPLVAEVLQHKASYQYIAEVMSHKTYGQTVCNKLVRAMSGLNEEVAPPFGDQVLTGKNKDMGDLPPPEEGEEEMEDLPPEEGDDQLGIEDQPCPDCNPDGQTEGDPNCQTCGGQGFVAPEEGAEDLDMGINQDAMPPGGPDMGSPMMNQSPAMQNFQRAMMRRF